MAPGARKGFRGPSGATQVLTIKATCGGCSGKEPRLQVATKVQDGGRDIGRSVGRMAVPTVGKG